MIIDDDRHHFNIPLWKELKYPVGLLMFFTFLALSVYLIYLFPCQMENKMVVLCCNLKPAKMRGILSQAMVMCASSPEKVEILDPPLGSVPGDRVSFDGYPSEFNSFQFSFRNFELCPCLNKLPQAHPEVKFLSHLLSHWYSSSFKMIFRNHQHPSKNIDIFNF